MFCMLLNFIYALYSLVDRQSAGRQNSTQSGYCPEMVIHSVVVNLDCQACISELRFFVIFSPMAYGSR